MCQNNPNIIFGPAFMATISAREAFPEETACDCCLHSCMLIRMIFGFLYYHMNSYWPLCVGFAYLSLLDCGAIHTQKGHRRSYIILRQRDALIPPDVTIISYV